MKHLSKVGIAFLATVLVTFSSHAATTSVEVLHWWTSGGEAAALNVLKEDMKKKGYRWVDSPIAGGGGEQAMTTLKARVNAGKPPTAVQFLGYDIIDWAQLDVLANLNEIAAKENWGSVVPEPLQKFSKYEGKWVAAPVNIHSNNWVWANKKIFDELNIQEPKTWNQLIAAAKKIKKAGYIGIAHGGQAWQEAVMFDTLVLVTGGPDFYRKALIELDQKALTSATMRRVFARMEQIRELVDENFSGRDWNLATAMVIEGKAGLQLMGDWAKGEFLNAGKVPGEDFLCFRTPGTDNQLVFLADQFAMFEVGKDAQEAQFALASSIMAPSFQIAFNKVKGSVPARTDISDAEFDSCAQAGMEDLVQAGKNGGMVGSLAHGHAVPAAIKNAAYDVITAHFNGEYNAAQATKELAEAIADAQ